LGGCATVKPEQHEADLAQLREELMGAIEQGDQQTAAGTNARVDEVARQVAALSDQLEALASEFDAKIATMEARLSVDMPVHFGFDDAAIREADKPALDQFATVIREHHPSVTITVEGFTDPAGDEEYNRWLGQQRADAVRQYLVDVGGLDAARVKAVSYGEATNRMVEPGAWGEDGLANRRVALVVDYLGSTR
jgi:peptidoglycan-associated lipoprotein